MLKRLFCLRPFQDSVFNQLSKPAAMNLDPAQLFPLLAFLRFKPAYLIIVHFLDNYLLKTSFCTGLITIYQL